MDALIQSLKDAYHAVADPSQGPEAKTAVVAKVGKVLESFASTPRKTFGFPDMDVSTLITCMVGADGPGMALPYADAAYEKLCAATGD